MAELLKEFIKLAGNPEYTHRLQDPIEEYKELALKIQLSGNKPEAVICLNKPFEEFIQSIFSNVRIFHYQPSRVRNILDQRLKTTEYIVTKGEKPEIIKEYLRPKSKVWMIDTIAFSGGTLNKTLNDLDLNKKDLTLVVMAITPKVKEELEKRGIKTIYNFEIRGIIEDLWHIDDFLNPTPTFTLHRQNVDFQIRDFPAILRGAPKKEEISADELFEILLPYFKGEKQLEEIIKEHRIPNLLTNPNLLFSCGKGGYVSKHISTEKLVKNQSEIKEILRKAEILIGVNENWLKEIKLEKVKN
jgi:hypoxanthine phosphoribosyltransferase